MANSKPVVKPAAPASSTPKPAPKPDPQQSYYVDQQQQTQQK